MSGITGNTVWLKHSVSRGLSVDQLSVSFCELVDNDRGISKIDNLPRTLNHRKPPIYWGVSFPFWLKKVFKHIIENCEQLIKKTDSVLKSIVFITKNSLIRTNDPIDTTFQQNRLDYQCTFYIYKLMSMFANFIQ